jgi:hypothetical protein
MSRRLTPVAIAQDLFAIPPDRDERASQVCAETLMTLVANGYAAPQHARELASPKRERWATRCLALSVNFLSERSEGRAGAEDMTPQRYGEALASGDDFLASANLRLAKRAFEGVIDPSTRSGQRGSWLLFPFHEALLWYDARQQRGHPWRVRKVYMRGSGIMLARLLADPPSGGDPARGTEAVAAIKRALNEASPLARIAQHLEEPLADMYEHDHPPVEGEERNAWEAGGADRLGMLSSRLCRHGEGAMNQGSASGPAKLWQLRTILALDLALHALMCAWDRLGTAQTERHLVLSIGGPPRADNRIRLTSEETYKQARIALNEATIQALAGAMDGIHASSHGPVSWNDEFEPRALRRLGHVAAALSGARGTLEFERWAREAVEGADYDRTGHGFRVLLESIGMLASTGAYRYLTATPDLLSAMVGALSAEMPMPSDRFFARVFEEWRIVVGPGELAGTSLVEQVDGADLARNQARAEAAMVEAGLAVGLSDRTTVVGERARRQA